MTDRARDAVVSAIRDHGPISFAEFMQHALNGPGGFYEDPRIGPSGAFVTSPHVHPVFGQLLGRAVRDLHTLLGRPEPFRLVEIGAGDGTLARQLLDELGGRGTRYTAVETSPGARKRLAEIRDLEVEEDLPAAADVVLAHELLDNLPVRVVRGDREVRIGLEGERLTEVVVPLDRSLGSLAAAARPRLADATFDEGPVALAGDNGDEADVVVPVGAFDVVDRISDMLSPGFALLIDYGDVGSTGGPIHGYRGHRIVDDVLADPGSSDVTVGVDFDAIARRAEMRGLRAFTPVTQRDALVALGFEHWVRTELERQRTLLDEGAGTQAVRTWSDRSRATLLVDPAALGRLRWMLLASPTLSPPAWVGIERRGV
jgi:NADH dehydrogenase [ubiquinone] 1 alpha subcomplex assembly factor 7